MSLAHWNAYRGTLSRTLYIVFWMRWSARTLHLRNLLGTPSVAPLSSFDFYTSIRIISYHETDSYSEVRYA